MSENKSDVREKSGKKSGGKPKMKIKGKESKHMQEKVKLKMGGRWPQRALRKFDILQAPFLCARVSHSLRIFFSFFALSPHHFHSRWPEKTCP